MKKTNVKKTNVKTTKKICLAILSATLVLGLLTGCGKKGAFTVDGPELDMNEVMEKVEEGYTEEVQEAAEAVEEEVQEVAEEVGTVATPFLADMEKYESILATLTKNQYYGFACVGEGEDILLVTDGVYDYGDGLMAAIDAKVYAFGNDGQIYEAGSVWSDGTAYPIAVYENSLMFGGNHRMVMATVRDGSVVIEKEADEVFDEQGNATYSYDEGDIDNIQELSDDSKLKEMFDMYGNATAIGFFQN